MSAKLCRFGKKEEGEGKNSSKFFTEILLNYSSLGLFLCHHTYVDALVLLGGTHSKLSDKEIKCTEGLHVSKDGSSLWVACAYLGHILRFDQRRAGSGHVWIRSRKPAASLPGLLSPWNIIGHGNYLFIAAHEEQSDHGDYRIPTPDPTGLVWVSSTTKAKGRGDDRKSSYKTCALLNRPSAIAFIGDFMFVTSFVTKEMAVAIGEAAATPENPQRCIVKIPRRGVLEGWKNLGKQSYEVFAFATTGFSPWGLTVLDTYVGNGQERGAVLCATSHRGFIVAMIDPNNGKMLSRWDRKVHMDLLHSKPSANVIMAT